ncbi:MAG: hypothetical protein ACRDTE_16935, partial [Pseudonocardiaceae bacterium]
HYGIRELCDICPLSQLELCAGAHRVPSPDRLREVASTLPEARDLVVVDITDRHVSDQMHQWRVLIPDHRRGSLSVAA